MEVDGDRTPAESRESLIVGIAGPYVTAIPEGRCLGLIAYKRAKTWGELRRNPSHEFMEELDAKCREAIEGWGWEWPTDNTPLIHWEVPGAGDGDWPFPVQDMLDIVPDEIAARFGEIVTTRLNGDLLAIDPKDIDAFIEAMAEAGFDCIRDDQAVAAAVLG